MGFFSINNAAAIEAARVGFHAAFIEQLGIANNNPLSQMLTEVPSSAGIEEWDWMGDLPDFEEWKGDRFLAGLEAFKLRVTNKDWSSGIRVHQNTIKDDKLGLIQPKIALLADKAKTHRIRLMMRLLINGFTGLAYPDVGNGLGYDGAMFFGTTRTSGSNKLTTALSEAALESAEVLLQSQMSLDGVTPLDDIQGTHLIVGPKLAPLANRIMGSDYVPNASGTATQSNYLRGRYQVVVSPLLRGTFDDYWFLADLSKSIKPFLFQMREEISTSAVVGTGSVDRQNGVGGQGGGDSEPRFKRGELWFGAEARYNVAPFEHRLIVGSQVA